MTETASLILFGLAAAFIFIFFSAIRLVPESQEWTMERFGKFICIMRPGLNFLMPFVDRVGRKISLAEQVLDIPHQDVITKDNAMVAVDGVVFYRVFDIEKAAYRVVNLKLAITQLTLTNIRTVMGEMELDSLLSNREIINAKLLAVIDEATDPWGVKLTRIEIKDIRPPRDLQEAMGRQMKAEREKRAVILESEGLREAAINKADGEKQARILEAEGKKQETILKAEAREREAAAEGVALQAVASGNQQAMQYFLSQASIKALKDVASAKNHKTVVLPLAATNVLGAMAGVAELGKDLLAPVKPEAERKQKKA